MGDTVIDYGDYKVRVRVRRPDAEVTSAKKDNPVYDCWVRFTQLGADVKAPTRKATGEDIGTLARLMKTYDTDTLLEMARIFWGGYAEPVMEGRVPAMRLFAHEIPNIKRTL